MRGINGERTALARSREIHLKASPRKGEEQRVAVHIAGRGYCRSDCHGQQAAGFLTPARSNGMTVTAKRPSTTPAMQGRRAANFITSATWVRSTLTSCDLHHCQGCRIQGRRTGLALCRRPRSRLIAISVDAKGASGWAKTGEGGEGALTARFASITPSYSGAV